MKIALYIEDGLEQIVLTPTSETEKAILEKIHDGTRELSIKRGEFYGCRGGWMRQKKRYPNYGGMGGDEPNDESTMIVLREKTEPTPPSDRTKSVAGSTVSGDSNG
jgi:hypothetical protein